MSGDVMMDRLDMLKHADGIAAYVASYSMLTAQQAYEALMGCVNALVDDNQPAQAAEEVGE